MAQNKTHKKFSDPFIKETTVGILDPSWKTLSSHGKRTAVRIPAEALPPTVLKYGVYSCSSSTLQSQTCVPAAKDSRQPITTRSNVGFSVLSKNTSTHVRTKREPNLSLFFDHRLTVLKQLGQVPPTPMTPRRWRIWMLV